MFEVKHPNKGLLIPRVALTGNTDVQTIPSPAVSLLIYNLSSITGAAAVTPGYYYWDGSAWLKLNTGSPSVTTGWLLSGNAGTTPSSDYIGTSDNFSLQFKVNNQKAGYVGINTNDGNVFWGYQSGMNSLGYSNVALGIRSLYGNTSVSNLVAVGDSALHKNTTGDRNTAVGSKALHNNTAGTRNTANGFMTLFANTTGGYNSGHGYNSLASNTTGTFNTGLGVSALFANTTGNDNTATGVSAMTLNTTGNYNVAMGRDALRANNSGNSNVAIGIKALSTITSLSNMVAIGDSALMKNTTGAFNTAVGSKTLYANTTGHSNLAAGTNALYSNTIGYDNTGLGQRALIANSTGIGNTAVGSTAMENSTIGGYNTSVGWSSMHGNTTGAENTAFGSLALNGNTSGSGNTAIGTWTLSNNTSGTNNTAIGNIAGVANGNLTNATAIGYNAVVSTSNTIQIGNASVTDVFFGNGNAVLHASMNISPSDKRFKYQIQNNVPGLEFITKLSPVTYYIDDEKIKEFSRTGIISNDFIFRTGSNENKQLRTGFIAQDVELVANKIGYQFDGIQAPLNGKGHYGLAYNQFIMPLVKSVQEQQQIIENQEKAIRMQAVEIKKLNDEMIQLRRAVEQLIKK